MFNFINLCLRKIKGFSKPFGGISIIAIGDLFQLKPVLDSWIFNDLNIDYGPLVSNLWKDHFSLFELDEIMRQKDDCMFADILNRFREGKQTQSDMTVLQSCIKCDENIPSVLPRLFTTRKEVYLYNLHVCMFIILYTIT